MENINLIRKIAWSFHFTTGLEWDDLFQEAALAYLVALKYYDPDRGALSTHMWCSITSHIKNYLKKQNEWYDVVFPIEEIEEVPSDPDELWEMIGENGKKVLELIVRFPDRWYGSSADMKRQVRAELIAKGERYKIVKLGFKECEIAVR